MKVTTLMENGRIDDRLKQAHGLSMYIEHKESKILFDLGPNNNFLVNAKILGIDLAEVDTVIISHGHFDHGNGLKKFMKINSKAKIYLSEEAFGKQYKKIGFLHIPIGIKKPKELDRIVFVDKNIKISPDIRIYAKLENMKLIIGDDSLLTKKGDKLVKDLFDHEIYLVIENENSNVLFSGCSHKGIENIVDVLEKKESRSITHVLGGFHMSHYDTKNSAQTIYLESLGQKFYKKNVKTFYSCHCTGDNAYDALKPQMMEKLVRIKTGTVINL